jgi:bifunctional pyridoxal-dependent enzyme with beta-cystathionase and maltose regulon repressor activities
MSFEHLSGQTKDYNIGICCFSIMTKYAAWSKNKDWLAQNLDNMSGNNVIFNERYNKKLQ